MLPKSVLTLSLILAVWVPHCAPAMKPTVPAAQVVMSELWEEPQDLEHSDLFFGPWGAERAPEPDDTYTFVKPKTHGVNPGMTVTDSQGREWHVKQPREGDKGDEGPVEVVVSRVLSAVGYHQPPVYYLRTFTMTDAAGIHRDTPGGRFRLHGKFLKDRGEWSLQQNPFVGTRQYEGLLVILMMFNSSDLKSSNNSVYDVRSGPRGEQARWYVVRDLGTALGETGYAPKRGSIELFEKRTFIRKVDDGFVEFEFNGWQRELYRHRITIADVRWAGDLLGRLSEAQWRDAFRAGGYDQPTAERFIARLRRKVEDARTVRASRSEGGSHGQSH